MVAVVVAGGAYVVVVARWSHGFGWREARDAGRCSERRTSAHHGSVLMRVPHAVLGGVEREWWAQDDACRWVREEQHGMREREREDGERVYTVGSEREATEEQCAVSMCGG